jgi:hypothetical protein
MSTGELPTLSLSQRSERRAAWESAARKLEAAALPIAAETLFSLRASGGSSMEG